jgi:predicted ATP-grasp superfamily ATP-dependent carboligase
MDNWEKDLNELNIDISDLEKRAEDNVEQLKMELSQFKRDKVKRNNQVIDYDR